MYFRPFNFLVLLFLHCGFIFSQSQFNQEKFQNISIEEGLSQSSVYSIYQDSRGFLWFGTADGLNRYDGYEFKTYRNDPSDINTISDNTIRCISEDNEGNLWIGTNNGLNKSIRKENKFISEISNSAQNVN